MRRPSHFLVMVLVSIGAIRALVTSQLRVSLHLVLIEQGGRRQMIFEVAFAEQGLGFRNGNEGRLE